MRFRLIVMSAVPNTNISSGATQALWISRRREGWVMQIEGTQHSGVDLILLQKSFQN